MKRRIEAFINTAHIEPGKAALEKTQQEGEAEGEVGNKEGAGMQNEISWQKNCAMQ